MKDIEKAISELKDDLTCVLVKGDLIYTSNKKGIAPILDFINEGIDLNGFSVADRIVGRAISFLYIYSGIKEAYGEVMSYGAMDLLKKHHINYSYQNATDKIINRKGDDICPMEKTVIDVDDEKIAYKLLDEKLKSLRNK